jgi:hypothetical protein
MLFETMEQNCCSITIFVLQSNPIGNEGAGLLAAALGNHALLNLTTISISDCDIGDDEFIAQLSALEQNTSFLHLDLRHHLLSERVFLAFAESLPAIKVLQSVDLSWCIALTSAMPLLLAGFRKNTSLFRFLVTGCVPYSVPPTPEGTARFSGGWMQGMESLGYRNRFRSLIHIPKDTPPPRGFRSQALARQATFSDVVFEVLCSIPSLVPSKTSGGIEGAKDMGKRKRNDE